MSLWSKFFSPRHQHTTDSFTVIQQNLADGTAVMLDVRSQQEWDDGHLKDVVFIPITDLKSLPPGTASIDRLDKSKIVYCH